MKIYKIGNDVSKYQYLLTDDKEFRKKGGMIMDCQPKLETWASPECYVYKPKHRRGNFLGFGMTSGGFALDAQTRWHDEVSGMLEMSGELLPLPHEGEMLYVLNVLECVNALDAERSTFDPPDRKLGLPQTYVFHRQRVPETPLFKIPETHTTEILCAEDYCDEDMEFKRAYERAGMTGLIFREVWSDGQ